MYTLDMKDFFYLYFFHEIDGLKLLMVEITEGTKIELAMLWFLAE